MIDGMSLCLGLFEQYLMLSFPKVDGGTFDSDSQTSNIGPPETET